MQRLIRIASYGDHKKAILWEEKAWLRQRQFSCCMQRRQRYLSVLLCSQRDRRRSAVGRSRSLGSGIRDASYGRVGMNSISICHLRRRLQPREAAEARRRRRRRRRRNWPRLRHKSNVSLDSPLRRNRGGREPEDRAREREWRPKRIT